MLRLLPLTALLLMLPTIANAAEWVAEMVEDEGGPVLTAYVEGDGPGQYPPQLSLTCFDEVGLRYLPAGDHGAPEMALDFAFSTEDEEQTLSMQYEEMDGAFAAYFPKTEKLIGMLEGGSDLLIRSADGSVPPQTFALAGSKAAIETVLAACK